jgi:uncharacterized protein YbjT (DUF2867 family)
MGKIAIILGASGLTGGIILDKLLVDDRYSTIKIFSRKSIKNKNSKIIERTGNLIELENFKDDFTADEVYCCIGTTAKKTPDKKVYKNIDYGIPVKAAKLCIENEIDTFLVISSLGANPNSSVFYNRTKGQMEVDVLKENIKNCYILRPSLILGDRGERRIGESIGIGLMQFFRIILVGKLKKYRAITAEKIANAMIYLANKKTEILIIESDKIVEFSED